MGPTQRWIVKASERLGALLERADAATALADGRVFVNGRRTTEASLELEPGARVEVYRARAAVEPPQILHEDAGLVVVSKPAGMATEPERRGSRQSLTHEVARALGVPVAAVHALSRLDLGVSGAVLLGVTPEARQRAARLRGEGKLRRRYVAIAAATPEPPFGTWTSTIATARETPRRRISTDGKPAVTRYRVTGIGSPVASGRPSVLALEPLTGRTHQLRVQSAEHAAPLFGDPTYGGPRQFVLSDGAVRAFDRIYLHAAWVELGPEQRVHVALPPEFSALWQATGGAAGALENAVAVELGA